LDWSAAQEALLLIGRPGGGRARSVARRGWRYSFLDKIGIELLL
tara:strand:- start:190 stop:321 length:132 start_codon:yes stop_codon:yes gene_type:complete